MLMVINGNGDNASITANLPFFFTSQIHIIRSGDIQACSNEKMQNAVSTKLVKVQIGRFSETPRDTITVSGVVERNSQIDV